ncbi:hypothetical protein Tco_0683882 [Tanacetum coccineum]
MFVGERVWGFIHDIRGPRRDQAAVRLRLRYLGEIRLVLRAKMSIETPISLARLRLTSMALEARPWRLDNTLTPIEDTGCIT